MGLLRLCRVKMPLGGNRRYLDLQIMMVSLMEPGHLIQPYRMRQHVLVSVQILWVMYLNSKVKFLVKLLQADLMVYVQFHLKRQMLSIGVKRLVLAQILNLMINKQNVKL